MEGPVFRPARARQMPYDQRGRETSLWTPASERVEKAMDKDEKFGVVKTDDEWQQTLSPKQYEVLRQHGTEMRGSSPLNKEKRTGEFLCAGCGQALFDSGTKYES